MYSEYKMLNKRSIIVGTGLALLIIFLLILKRKQDTRKSFSIGIIADCQYCADPGSGIRKYAASESKLQECVDHLNTMELQYVIHLGDFIDRDLESFDVVKPIYNQLAMPKYHVLGNHDFSVADDKKNGVPKLMGLSSRYYDFEIKGWRFVVLDGNDISFHAYPAGSEQYNNANTYYEDNPIESPKWNGALGEKQLVWLRSVLENSLKVGEKVVLYCHFPIFPENPHNLWNANDIIEIIEEYACVKAYMNGHNHAGNYGNKKGIHYVTFKGMVDTDETSYAVIQVQEDRLEITGFGREESKVLEIRK